MDANAHNRSTRRRRTNHDSSEHTPSHEGEHRAADHESLSASQEQRELLPIPIAIEPSLLSDPRFNGRGNGPVRNSIIQGMQQTYGNRAVQRYLRGHNRASASPEGQASKRLPLQRALGGLLGHGTSVADALKSKDPGDVKDVWLEDIKMASYDDRIALIRILAYQGWVGPRDRSKLEEIWGTFPALQLVSTVSREVVLWHHCVEVAPGLADLSVVKDAAKDFKKDISTKALFFLGRNRQVIEKEMARFGMIPTTDPNAAKLLAPAAANDEQKKQLKEMQKAAQLVKNYQNRLKEMSKVLVGKGFQPFNPNNRPIDDFMVGPDVAGLYGRDKQDEQPGYSPNNAPNASTSTNTSVDPNAKVVKKGTWDLVKEQWDFVNGRISSIANAFPTIFAALNAGTVSTDDLASIDPDKDPKAAASALHNVQLVMNAAYKNISKATKNIEDDRTNPLDLKPVYEQLFSGLKVEGGTGRDWTSPFNQWVGKREVKEHKQIEAYIALAMEAAEYAVFVASVVGTGGAAAFLAVSAASVGIPGLKAALSAEKYDVLASANKGQVRSDLAIVDKKDVDLAKMQSEQDEMAFKMAILTTFVGGIAHGMTEAKAIKAAKESGAGQGGQGGPGTKRPGEPHADLSGDSTMEGCFVAGTLVLTPDGTRVIESLRPGDVVTAYDLASGVTADHRLNRAFVHVVPAVLDIQVGITWVTCSPPHPFWVPGTGWQRAGDLRPGTSLYTKDGSTVSIISIQERRGPFTVYNIEVDGLHTYHVSDVGVLVHNKAARAMKYKLQPGDVDWRGTGKTSREAVDEAFRRTGVPKDQFEVTKWGPTEHGKSMPTEWRATKGPNRGAEVSVDMAHVKNGPDAPHVGWQGPGKKAASGHIILDDVHVNRPTR